MRRRMINALRTAEQKARLLQPKEVIHEEVKVEAPKEVLKYGPAKMCPKCFKVKAYYFHVKNCWASQVQA